MARTRSRRVIAGAAGALLTLMASQAHAEVADKEPSLAWLWSCAILAIVLTYLLGRVRIWLGAIICALWLFGAWANHLEITSPDVGPAMLAELGESYINQNYAASTVGVIGSLLALLLAWRARSAKEDAAPLANKTRHR